MALGQGDGVEDEGLDPSLVADDGRDSHGFADYTAEELLEQAQSNAQATIIATVAFLTQRGVALDEWTDALGRTFARGWDEPHPWEAGEFMDAMLTNFRSLGAEVVAAELGLDQAEAVTTGFPDHDLCAMFGVAPDRVARINDATTVLAHDRGIIWEWHLDGERTRYLARRADRR